MANLQYYSDIGRAIGLPMTDIYGDPVSGATWSINGVNYYETYDKPSAAQQASIISAQATATQASTAASYRRSAGFTNANLISYTNTYYAATAARHLTDLYNKYTYFNTYAATIGLSEKDLLLASYTRSTQNLITQTDFHRYRADLDKALQLQEIGERKTIETASTNLSASQETAQANLSLLDAGTQRAVNVQERTNLDYSLANIGVSQEQTRREGLKQLGAQAANIGASGFASRTGSAGRALADISETTRLKQSVLSNEALINRGQATIKGLEDILLQREQQRWGTKITDIEASRAQRVGDLATLATTATASATQRGDLENLLATTTQSQGLAQSLNEYNLQFSKVGTQTAYTQWEALADYNVKVADLNAEKIYQAQKLSYENQIASSLANANVG